MEPSVSQKWPQTKFSADLQKEVFKCLFNKFVGCKADREKLLSTQTLFTIGKKRPLGWNSEAKKNWEEFLAKLKKSIFNFFLAFCSFSLEQQQPSLDVEQRRLRNKKILAERVWLTSGPGTMTTFGTYILILRDLRGYHELGYVARLEDINLRLFAIGYNYTVVK